MFPKKAKPVKPLTLGQIGVMATYRLVIIGCAFVFLIVGINSEGTLRHSFIISAMILSGVWMWLTLKWIRRVKLSLRAIKEEEEQREKDAESR